MNSPELEARLLQLESRILALDAASRVSIADVYALLDSFVQAELHWIAAQKKALLDGPSALVPFDVFAAFLAKRKELLQRELLLLEHSQPRLAAQLQEHIDRYATRYPYDY